VSLRFPLGVPEKKRDLITRRDHLLWSQWSPSSSVAGLHGQQRRINQGKGRVIANSVNAGYRGGAPTQLACARLSAPQKKKKEDGKEL